MKKLMIWMVGLMVMFSAALDANATSALGVLRFATEATYPPFEYIDESGNIKGFDIEIANALCSQMRMQCTFSNQSFNSLIPSLNLGKFDVLIAALGVTPEREKQVNFTDSYYEPSASFVSPLAKHDTLTSVIGKTVAVQQSSTFERYLNEKYRSKVKIKTYLSIQDAFLDLVSGRVDMVMADTPIAKAWLSQNDNNKKYTIVDKPIVDHAYFGTGYGIAVRKDNIQLKIALQKALAEIKKNGTYDQIVKRYFGN